MACYILKTNIALVLLFSFVITVSTSIAGEMEKARNGINSAGKPLHEVAGKIGKEINIGAKKTKDSVKKAVKKSK